MFKGIIFILILGFIVVLAIIVIIASFVYRTIHHMKKMLKGEDPDAPDDNYNPEINRKHQHYTHGAYGRNRARTSYQQDFACESAANNQQTNDSASSQNDDSRKTGTGEILFETRNSEEVNRQIFSADEGEYVEFVEEEH